MKITIKYDDKFMIGEKGISESRINSFNKRLMDACSWLKKLHNAGEVGFLSLPEDMENLKHLKSLVDNVDKKIKEVVILGIGGSSLGPKALYSALKPAYYDLKPDKKRIHFPDNIDPNSFKALLNVLDLEKTLFLVITKSGGTAETAVQFMIVWDTLVKKFGEEKAKNHLIAVTDPETGNLRVLVDELKLTSAPIPANIGGRFSVFSSVGLLLALLADMDVDSFMAGGKAMVDSFLNAEDPTKHMAIRASAIFYLLHTEKNKPIHVLMPYNDSLYPTSLWFNQLWAESLGKRKNLQGEDIFVGPTPVSAKGATDQHSQIQLYVEGPADKIITFITVDEYKEKMEIPSVFSHIDSYSYLNNHSMEKLLKIELKASALALNTAGRPNGTIHLEKLDSYNLGQLLVFFEIATAISGKLYNVDPFNQPGVEQGKKYAYGALGRPGFEKEGKIMNEI
jgi:glucose-6-phosphate isomerase